ncbi:lipoprotein [Borreliella chilensis]|uniref:Lipoprotein n=1 Tax=Borreliella chilensis TaxID=1245910 RepID=A0A0A7UWI4_9SPIR|nr:lipoprotein [Borreliella chilensis]
MLKILRKIITISCLMGCTSIPYSPPKQNLNYLMELLPDANLYAHINLIKNRSIYSSLSPKYKSILGLVNNLYFSYKKENNDFAILIMGNFPKDIFWGIHKNRNTESIGNILTSPKWKLKNSNIYITPNRARTSITITQKDKTIKKDNMLTTKYIKEIEKNEMFFWIQDPTLLFPRQIASSSKNLIPFNSGTLTISSLNQKEYILKSLIETNNPAILKILSKKLIPNILTNITNLSISSQIKATIKDQNTVEIEFNIQKSSVENLIAKLASNI